MEVVRSGTALPGFECPGIMTSGATINVATRGEGVPLLLLHGYPETHRMWHKVAPALAEEFAVVCADLRRYGDSSKPEGKAGHSNYSKRAMAGDMVEVMAALGHREFLLAGHNRGGRVAYRLALDRAACEDYRAGTTSSPADGRGDRLRAFFRS